MAVVPCHTIDQANLLAKAVQVAVPLETLAVLAQWGRARCGDCENGDDSSLLGWKINTVVIKIVFKNDNGGRIDACD